MLNPAVWVTNDVNEYTKPRYSCAPCSAWRWLFTFGWDGSVTLSVVGWSSGAHSLLTLVRSVYAFRAAVRASWTGLEPRVPLLITSFQSALPFIAFNKPLGAARAVAYVASRSQNASTPIWQCIRACFAAHRAMCTCTCAERAQQPVAAAPTSSPAGWLIACPASPARQPRGGASTP